MYEEAAVTQPGRDELIRWRASKPSNFFTALPDLVSIIELRMGQTPSPSLIERLSTFGETVATVIEPAVQILERNQEFPKLRPYDELGQHIDEIEFHPAQYDAARAAWGSGILATTLDFDGAFELAAQFLLLSHVGEGGQGCPVVCTAGLRRAIEHRASDELKERYLSRLTATDAALALRGSQFLTEVQGGSDVGANVVEAAPDPHVVGAWRLTGEKWFCSVADADLFAVTARPAGADPGTKGLACFVIPRTLDGVTPNGFRLRRLKDKLGTRALASAEIDFENALAWPIGELHDGFKIAVTELLNTSRWLNAIGSTGIMCRAYLEASTFAQHREAFGSPIASFPTVREQLALMKTEAAASLASTFALTELVAKIDGGVATESDIAIHRFLVNANKYVTSITASDIVHRAIEVLGGNGTIEDFSPLPRLYRDAVVFESWEGTHNVLCAQVYRDCARLGLVDHIVTWVENELAQLDHPDGKNPTQVLLSLGDLQPRLTRSFEDSEYSAQHFRRQLSALMDIIQATCLLREANQSTASSEKTAIAKLFIKYHLAAQKPLGEPSWTKFIDQALGADLAPWQTSADPGSQEAE
jgi:alkylation response protein AidB-like acyl-CoA dehydrogenase